MAFHYITIALIIHLFVAFMTWYSNCLVPDFHLLESTGRQLALFKSAPSTWPGIYKAFKCLSNKWINLRIKKKIQLFFWLPNIFFWTPGTVFKGRNQSVKWGLFMGQLWTPQWKYYSLWSLAKELLWLIIEDLPCGCWVSYCREENCSLHNHTL